MKFLAESVKVGEHLLMVGGWYLHPHYPNGRVQIGYPERCEEPMMLSYVSDGAGGWIPHRWVELCGWDASVMTLA